MHVVVVDEKRNCRAHFPYMNSVKINGRRVICKCELTQLGDITLSLLESEHIEITEDLNDLLDLGGDE